MERVMRILPVFIILLLFSASIILCYIGWVAFSGREDHFTIQKINGPLTKIVRNRPLIGDGDLTFDNLNEKKEPNPNDPENEGLPPGLITVNEEVLKDPDVQRNVDLLKMKVISKLRKHILDGAKVKGHLNEYGVDFSMLKKPRSQRLNRKHVICKLKSVKMKLIDQNSSPVFKHKPFPTVPLFHEEGEGNKKDSGSENRPEKPFVGEIKPQPFFKKCAVISNSAALDGAKHGIDIDSHDFIIRFNNAPTAGFENDVGSLTSLRIVNSQVVTKPQFGFPSTKFQRHYEAQSHFAKNNVTPEHKDPTEDERITKMELAAMSLDTVWDGTRKYLFWDPCSYSSTLEEWYKKPDFPLFDKYFNLTNQEHLHEKNRYYMLDCRVIWRLWEVLQEYSITKIYGNPPTSGFIGIALALQVCDRVNIYEYVPSIRESKRCHYYGPKNESNPSCTYGSWHPVSAEKLFFLSISDGSDKEVFMDGVLTLPGVSQFDC